MKHILLTILFLFLFIYLFAQTGMFGISFGQEKSKVQTELKAKGFVETDKTVSIFNYTNSKIPDLASLKLYINEEKGIVTGWVVKYSVNGDQAKIDKIFNDLTEMHDVSPFYDDYYEEHVWELDNGKAAYVYVDPDSSTLTIDYTEFDDSYYWY